jgi:hypothetical protein
MPVSLRVHSRGGALGRLHVRRFRDAEGGRDMVRVFEQMVAGDQATFRPSLACGTDRRSTPRISASGRTLCGWVHPRSHM